MAAVVLALAAGALMLGGGRRQPDEPVSGGGLARRANPVFPERAESGTWLRPLPTHRKMGSVYHTISTSRFEIGGVATRTGLVPPVGYAVARLPMSSGADGTIGAVLLAGQWLVAWSAVLDDATVRDWSGAGGLKIDQYPDIGFTVRAAVDTRELSKSESSSSYSCTVIADVTINGVTTETLVPRAVLTLSRAGADAKVEANGQRLKGDLLSLRANWKLRLSDFTSGGGAGEGAGNGAGNGLGDGAGLPLVVDVGIDMMCSTVPPEFQGDVEEPKPAEGSEPGREAK